MSSDNEDPADGRAPEGPTEIIDTDYEVGQDNYVRKKAGSRSTSTIRCSLISGIAIVGFVILTLFTGPIATDAFIALRDF